VHAAWTENTLRRCKRNFDEAAITRQFQNKVGCAGLVASVRTAKAVKRGSGKDKEKKLDARAPMETRATCARAVEADVESWWEPTSTHSGVPYMVDVHVQSLHQSTVSSKRDAATPHILSCDTQASFGITGSLELFGGVALQTDIDSNVVD
jgi:hypothetical protein